MNRTNFTRIMICLALLIAHFALPSPVSACSCVMPGPPIDEFSNFDAVFTGKVIAVSANYSPVISLLDRMLARLNLRPTFLYTNRFWGYEVTFAVHKSWKHVSTTSVTVLTGSGGGDCGYSFNRGDDYLVYAYKLQDGLGDGLGAHICSRTREISGAAEDLSYLNTMPTLPLTPVYDYSWLYLAGTIFFVIAVLLLLAFVLRWRRRQRQATTDQPQG